MGDKFRLGMQNPRREVRSFIYYKSSSSGGGRGDRWPIEKLRHNHIVARVRGHTHWLCADMVVLTSFGYLTYVGYITLPTGPRCEYLRGPVGNQQNICCGFESHLLRISDFFKKRRKEMTYFASVRAGDVNGYDSLPLSTTVVHGEGRAPEIPVAKSMRVN